MSFEVQLDKEAVERQIVQTITESAIGQRIEAEINKALSQEKQWRAENIIEQAVKACVYEQIRIAATEALRGNAEFAAKVRSAVEVHTTEEVIASYIKSIFAAGLKD